MRFDMHRLDGRMDVRCLLIGSIDMHQSDLQCVPADRPVGEFGA